MMYSKKKGFGGGLLKLIGENATCRSR